MARPLQRWRRDAAAATAMTTALTTAICVEATPAKGPGLAADLAAAGIVVVGRAEADTLVREAARLAPDVVVCHEASPDERLFVACDLLADVAPCPVALFTEDFDAAKTERAVRAGIHAYVIAGYDTRRLRAVVQLARSRFARENELRLALADVRRRYDDRKLVDRAKGILMRARQFSEEEAFSLLRAASMHSNRRVGQVSKQVIAAARDADAVNRAGKLRMGSQRLVKVAAADAFPGPAGVPPAAPARAAAHADGLERLLAVLGERLSRPTFGDLLDAVEASARPLCALARTVPLGVDRLPELDALAERLLHDADRLVAQLEAAGLVTTLSILNTAGRQRMLSQRFAKDALLEAVLPAPLTARVRDDRLATAQSFAEANDALRQAPLSTAEIRALLDRAADAWSTLQQRARTLRRREDVQALDGASDALLDVHEELADRYERSMHMLMG